MYVTGPCRNLIILIGFKSFNVNFLASSGSDFTFWTNPVMLLPIPAVIMSLRLKPALSKVVSVRIKIRYSATTKTDRADHTILDDDDEDRVGVDERKFIASSSLVSMDCPNSCDPKILTLLFSCRVVVVADTDFDDTCPTVRRPATQAFGCAVNDSPLGMSTAPRTRAKNDDKVAKKNFPSFVMVDIRTVVTFFNRDLWG